MNENDRSRIPIDLIIKLFETLKDSNNDLKININKQTDAIVHLSSLLKEGVTLDELKKIIDDHNTHSGDHLDNIDTCTESIQDNSGIIIKTLKGLSRRVHTMILVVCVSFALMTLAYFFVSSSVETIVNDKMDSIGIEEKVTYDHSHKELMKEIEKIRKQIEELH